MTTWPDTLPASPLLDGFRETVQNTALRTEMEQGPAKLRRRTTAGVRTMSVAFVLSAAQVAILDTFYLTTLQGGTLSFDFTHPRTAAAVTCRFVKPPEYGVLNGAYFKTALDLEIVP